MRATGQYGAAGPDDARTPFAAVGKIILGRGEVVQLAGGVSLALPDGAALAVIDHLAWPTVTATVKGDQITSDDHPGYLFEVSSAERPIAGRLPLMLKVLRS
jgi:hypothetical protein